MNPLEEHILDKFKVLLMKRINLNYLILFGSRARGDADPDSDMDVLVVVDELSKEVEDYISDCAWEASVKHGIVMVPIVFSIHEWERSPERSSLLADAVRAEGIFI
jgi:predicted nucleotidyltransferase